MPDPTIDERIVAVEAALQGFGKTPGATIVEHVRPIITAYREQQIRYNNRHRMWEEAHAEIERLQALQRDHDIHTDRLVTDANQLGVENARLRGFVEAVRGARSLMGEGVRRWYAYQPEPIDAALTALDQSSD